MTVKNKLDERGEAFLAKRAGAGRNDRPYDAWSLVHLLTGVFFGMVFPPLTAIILMVLWEPLEILVLSPLLAKYNIDFGYETLKNSLSDIAVDIIGITIGYYLVSLAG